MAVIAYPRAAYSYPSQRQIARGPNLEHPLLRGLRLHVMWLNIPGLIKTGGGGVAINEVTGERATVPVGITREGPWADFNGASKFQFAGVPFWDSDPLFVMAWCRSDTGDQARTIAQHGDNGGARGWKMQSNWGARFRYTAAGIAHYETAVSVTTSCSVMALVRSGTTGLKYTDHTTNGALKLLATDTVGANWSDQTLGTDKFHIGGIDSGAEYWDGKILGVLCGAGAPTLPILQKIAADPFFAWRD